MTTELLCEMNPDVKGEYVCEGPDSQMNKGEPANYCVESLLTCMLLIRTPCSESRGRGFFVACICPPVRRENLCKHGVDRLQFFFSDCYTSGRVACSRAITQHAHLP